MLSVMQAPKGMAKNCSLWRQNNHACWIIWFILKLSHFCNFRTRNSCDFFRQVFCSIGVAWYFMWIIIFPRKLDLTFHANCLHFSPQKTGFDISCKLSPMETICMKCQIQFSGKNKKNISKCHLLKFLQLSVTPLMHKWNPPKEIPND